MSEVRYKKQDVRWDLMITEVPSPMQHWLISLSVDGEAASAVSFESGRSLPAWRGSSFFLDSSLTWRLIPDGINIDWSRRRSWIVRWHTALLLSIRHSLVILSIIITFQVEVSSFRQEERAPGRVLLRLSHYQGDKRGWNDAGEQRTWIPSTWTTWKAICL